LFVAAVKSYANSEDFWLDYSEASKNPCSGNQESQKRLGWTKVISKLRIVRKEGDKEDVEEAKALYPDPTEFKQVFCYRKGSKDIPLRQDAQIAQKYRQITGQMRFWDFQEENEGEELER
jgi:hypothetical protein